MLDIDAIHLAIDEFMKSNPTEDYHVHIEKDDRQRPYLGLSGLGEKCMRKLWYQWRHCFKPEFPPRMLSLFRRGDREEYIFVWILRGIGCTVHEVDESGKQFSVKDFSNHLSGHLDSVILFPQQFWLPGFTPRPLLGEFKTANDKQFNNCVKDGVEKWNSKYYGQQIAYCGYEKLDGSFFAVRNKNDDSLYLEFVPFKKSKFTALVNKAEEVIHSQEPLERMQYASAANWECKFCDAREICFKGAPSQKLCRTCKHASPAENASWVCGKGKEYGTVCSLYKDITKS